MSRPIRWQCIPPWLVPLFLLGATAAIAGGYWDDAWHTERGRDSFLIAPHIAIYGGVMVAGVALELWAFLFIRDNGFRALAGQRRLLLALIGVAVTIVAAPIDNSWHAAFGRDAVLWSPPHVLGIVGPAAMATAVLVDLARRDEPWARLLRPVVGGLIVAAFMFLVVEYDTDVPQFSPVWYLPVLALASSLAFSLVRLATREPFAATGAAAVQLLFVVAVSLFLKTEGFGAPKLPLLVVPALALDLTDERGLGVVRQSLAYTAALFAVYVPTLDLLGHGVTL